MSDSDHVVVRKDHLETLLKLVKPCVSCDAPATQERFELEAHSNIVARRIPCCDEHAVVEKMPAEPRDLPYAKAIRSVLCAATIVPSLAVKCPYDGIAFKKVPGYVSGYGCPVCKGLSYHLELHGSNELPDLTDVGHAVDHIKLLKGRIEKAVEVSDNDGGSASDAIQEMLYALMSEGEYFGR